MSNQKLAGFAASELLAVASELESTNKKASDDIKSYVEHVIRYLENSSADEEI